MTTLATLLTVLSTVVGVVAAVTAYAPGLDRPDTELVGLTLADPAGVQATAAAESVPLIPAGTVLGSAELQTLRAAGVERVRVLEFALGRWDEAPAFGASVLGLLTSAALMRRARRRAGSGVTAVHDEPVAVLARICEAVADLRAELARRPDEPSRLAHVLGVLGTLQRGDLPAFVATREDLVAAGGLAGYARVMDRFAGAERQLNRAWSAAADGVLDEARDSLDRAAVLLDEAAERATQVATLR